MVSIKLEGIGVKHTDEQKMILNLARHCGLPNVIVEFNKDELCKFFRASYARGMLQSEKNYMQLFLDPENQPTQFGTATQEYREQEVKEVQDLLTELAHHVRTKHHYGREVQKMLEKEAELRTRGKE